MSQPTRVKKALEAVAVAKSTGVTAAEAKPLVVTMKEIADTVEASPDLRAPMVHWRGELEAAIVRGDTGAQERAVAATAALAARWLP
ncbi:MAG TPA: hypothetical protein VGH09_06570 [Solirubrobacteraceae bacterium]|jgi:hypothetical protein